VEEEDCFYTYTKKNGYRWKTIVAVVPCVVGVVVGLRLVRPLLYCRAFPHPFHHRLFADETET
jgi:hypothetical protein